MAALLSAQRAVARRGWLVVVVMQRLFFLSLSLLLLLLLLLLRWRRRRRLVRLHGAEQHVTTLQHVLELVLAREEGKDAGHVDPERPHALVLAEEGVLPQALLGGPGEVRDAPEAAPRDDDAAERGV
jgi:hypothetical protein